MAETVAETGPEDAGTVVTLPALNADYVRVLVQSDIAWYADRLSDNFVCALGDPPGMRRSPARPAAARTPPW